MNWLFERSAAAWAHASAARHRWRGLALYGIDGSSLRVPDAQANRAYFGGQPGREGSVSGYPMARGVVLMALRSHVLAAVGLGAYGGTNELEHAKDLLCASTSNVPWATWLARTSRSTSRPALAAAAGSRSAPSSRPPNRLEHPPRTCVRVTDRGPRPCCPARRRAPAPRWNERWCGSARCTRRPCPPHRERIEGVGDRSDRATDSNQTRSRLGSAPPCEAGEGVCGFSRRR
jgi:hypothetical protein